MAVTVTYQYPVQGTTAPTAAQTLNKNTVRATVIATADADTTATITHNLGLTAAQLTEGAPEVTLCPILSQALTALSGWVCSAKAANTVTLTKLTSTGSGNARAQLAVVVKRPHTIQQ